MTEVKKKQFTPVQKAILIEFLEEHPQLVHQKQSNRHTNTEGRRLWQEVSDKLNSTPGASKTWEEWRKVLFIRCLLLSPNYSYLKFA